MPSVHDNSKYKCRGCGTIVEFADESGRLGNMRNCPNCGEMKWDQLVITKSCDFCSSTENPRWKYPCEDFMLPIAPGVPMQGFSGEWAACDKCHEYIERGDRNALIVRAAKIDPTKDSPLGQLLVRSAHAGFFRHRTGDAILDPDYQEVK